MNGKGTLNGFVNKHEEKDEYTWDVKANDRHYNDQFKKKCFLLFKKRKYSGNAITTSKYNFLTFLPLNLYEQFHRLANFYFLMIVFLQSVPAISNLPWFTTMLPLVILLGIRGAKDIADDFERHRSDHRINSRPCDILIGSSFRRKHWRDIHVGDLVRLWKDEFVPADLLLLHTSEPNSLCFVETMEIDGETNLKYKQALMITHTELSTEESLPAFDGRVICEEPNNRLHTYTGTLHWKGDEFPLDNGRMLLRGCRIRNTETCYGLVIFAGFDTKIMKNGGKVTLKRTRIDDIMNYLIIVIFIILVVLSFFLAIGAGVWEKLNGQKASYILDNNAKPTAAYRAFLTFWGYITVLNSVVPMALYMTLEFIHLVHSFFIDWDLEMYYKQTDTPAAARSTNLNEQLGQIEYIFSDKTGTLTQNIMTFKKCCINGQIYGTIPTGEPEIVDFSWNKYADGKLKFYDPALLEVIRSNQDTEVQEFFRLMALCHTVMADEKDGQPVYQAASPDEEALVTAARNFGYVFLSRTQDTITVSELGLKRTYGLLAIFDFSSVRKRMSVLLRDPEGKIKLYSKGADTVMFERLCQGCLQQEMTERALDSFAEETLRTLCVAWKEVPEDIFQEWSKKHHRASVALQGRAEELHAVYEEMETELKLLGVTAIEDKLQDGVPETIQKLQKGNIKIWVLTGDKQETAVNIGFACKLLTTDMDILDGQDISKILEGLQVTNNNDNTGIWNEKILFRQLNLSPYSKKALVITGELLNEILSPLGRGQKKLSCCNMCQRIMHRKKKVVTAQENEYQLKERAFMELASKCQTVICCRVTPKQKANMVKLVKRHKKAITLAIGDGANDVSMIKTAHIGVGISGQEGMQAVQASDYALAQFCYLQRLLLVHGRWSYFRLCKFLRYFFYKTFSGTLVHVWFSFFNGFTAQPIYETWFIPLYTVSYTSYPVLALALLEQDVSDKKCLQSPEQYKVGQREELFNNKMFFLIFLHSVLTSLMLFFIPYGAFAKTSVSNAASALDYQCFSLTISTAAVFTMTIEVMFEITYWTVYSVFAVVLSIALLFAMTFFTHSHILHKADPNLFLFPGASLNAFLQPYIWLTIILTVAVNIIPSVMMRLLRKYLSSPKIEHKSSYDVNEVEQNTVELKVHFKRNSTLRRSAYAFSYKEGYADLITSGTSIRRKNPARSKHRSGILPVAEPENVFVQEKTKENV
ncbi:phospholipid-transporting ATPase IC-like [Protopterus annectens]|uniref:phospholipid-transporting ATPase IC-like n=1 Tax=Protopterus annectens TaxID=7888 RepID=UPI001CF9F1BA|nr:phospholipid-transporting ATPase IC-like [Protopterus annectens]